MNKKCLGSVVCLLISLRCFADFNWTVWMAGGESHGLDLAADAHGNCYVVGGFTGTVEFGGNTLVSAGATDLFIAKVAANGAVAWILSAGGTNDDSALKVVVTPDGTAFVSGRLGGAAQFGNALSESNNAGGAFLARITRSGVVDWVRLLTNGTPETMSLAHNRVWLAGSMDGFLSASAWNHEGEQVKQVIFPDARVPADDMAVGINGAFYVCGTFWDSISFGNITLEYHHRLNRFLAKFDRKGRFLWAVNAVPDAADRSLTPLKVAIGRDEIVAVIGNMSYPFFFPGGIGGYPRYWGFFVGEYSSAGELIGGSIVGEYKGSYAGHDVAVDRRGNSYAAGHAISSYVGPTPYYDSALVLGPGIEYNIESDYPYDDHNARGICVDPKGFIYVTGDFQGMTSFGTNTIGSSVRLGAPHAFVTRLDDAVPRRGHKNVLRR